MKRASLLILILLVLSSFTVPEPRGLVNDYAGVLTDERRGAVEKVCAAVRNEGRGELAVVIVESVEGGDIAGFTQALFDAWKPGRKGKDDGLVLVVSVRDRKVRIQTGYGIEGVLPDGAIGEIIDRRMIPALKSGDYGAAVYNACVALYEKLPPGDKPTSRSNRQRGKASIFLVIVIFLVLNFLVGRYGRRRHGGFWPGGGYGGFGGFGGFGGGGGGFGGFGGFGGGSSGGGGAGRGW